MPTLAIAVDIIVITSMWFILSFPEFEDAAESFIVEDYFFVPDQRFLL